MLRELDFDFDLEAAGLAPGLVRLPNNTPRPAAAAAAAFCVLLYDGVDCTAQFVHAQRQKQVLLLLNPPCACISDT